MWFVVRRREARPDAPYWPGRRLLAAIDAIAWPALGVVATVRSQVPARLVGDVVVAVLVIAAMSRLRRAICVNHRYRFTTARWGRVLLALFVFGLLLQWIFQL
jgi:hypothetical protein